MVLARLILLKKYILITNMKLQKKNNQHFLTVPLALIQAMGWDKGTELTFKVAGKDRLELVRE